MTTKRGFHAADDSRIFPTRSIGNTRIAPVDDEAQNPDMAGLLKQRVEERLRTLGKNPFEAARAGDLERNFINDILDERKLSVRGQNLLKLAKALECSAEFLINAEATAPRSSEGGAAMTFLPVLHRVQAGLWYEVEQIVDAYRTPSRPVHADPRYAIWPQWLEEVIGDSVNAKIPPGAFAHVVDSIAMGYAPRAGDFVVVERRRAGGHVRERTIKQVAITEGGAVELWPRSTNAKWSEPVKLTLGTDANDEIEVEIVGLVVGAYLDF